MKLSSTLEFISESTEAQLILYGALLRILREATSLDEAQRIAQQAISEVLEEEH
jgi:hypothetical protein